MTVSAPFPEDNERVEQEEGEDLDEERTRIRWKDEEKVEMVMKMMNYGWLNTKHDE